MGRTEGILLGSAHYTEYTLILHHNIY